jgi:hypothetical protein
MNAINNYTARQWWKTIVFTMVSGLTSLILVLSNAMPLSAHRFGPSEGLMLVDYRHLDGGKDGVALIEMDPESRRFGRIQKLRFFGEDVLPHHLYFNHDETRLYSTALNEPYLFEIAYRKDHKGRPRLGRITPIDTGGNIIAEDMYFSEDGSRYYVTFLLGQGGDRDGSVGVFDAETNELIETIRALEPEDGSLEPPFILYPHGISANEELNFLMVTSDANPDGVSGTGNTVTLIDFETHELLKTYLVADSPEDLSETVEVLLLRDEFPPFALVTTVLGGDIWVASYNSDTGLFNEFEKKVEGGDQGFGVALEFYIYENRKGEKELYVSFASPGAINVYSLDALPDLPLKRTLMTGAGAHHMAFFETKSGREVLVSQNNLINIEGLNDGTLMVVDIYTGENLGTLDMVAKYGLMPESVEWAFGHGADTHH